MEPRSLAETSTGKPAELFIVKVTRRAEIVRWAAVHGLDGVSKLPVKVGGEMIPEHLRNAVEVKGDDLGRPEEELATRVSTEKDPSAVDLLRAVDVVLLSVPRTRGVGVAEENAESNVPEDGGSKTDRDGIHVVRVGVAHGGYEEREVEPGLGSNEAAGRDHDPEEDREDGGSDVVKNPAMDRGRRSEESPYWVGQE